jgi:hypothetical protein
MDLSVIVLQFGGSEMTLRAVETFRRHCRLPHELLVVDNGSPDPRDREALDRLENVQRLRLPENRGFGAGNNAAAREARGEFLLFLNNDTVTDLDFASEVVEAMRADPAVGIASPALRNADGTAQLSCGDLPSIGREAIDRFLYRAVDRGASWGLRHARRMAARTRAVEWVGGAAMFLRADLFRSLGGFDEGYFLYFEDKDLCARARRAGRRVLYCAGTSVVHLRGGSAGFKPSREIRTIYRASQRRFYDRHRPPWERWLLRLYQKASR